MAFFTFEYKSFSQMKRVTIKGFLPDSFVMTPDAAPMKTVYFLPGFSADSTEIITYLRLRRQKDIKNMAIIVVDGENRFYIDHPEKYQSYSTFVGKEIVSADNDRRDTACMLADKLDFTDREICILVRTLT